MMIYDLTNDVWIEYGTEDNFGHKVSQLPSGFEITNLKIINLIYLPLLIGIDIGSL